MRRAVILVQALAFVFWLSAVVLTVAFVIEVCQHGLKSLVMEIWEGPQE